MRRIFKILLSCILGTLFLTLIFFVREPTLAGKFFILKTGLTISLLFGLTALVIFLIFLVTYVKEIPPGVERRIRVYAREAGLDLIKSREKLKSLGGRAYMVLHELRERLSKEFKVPSYLIQPILEDEWKSIKRGNISLKSTIDLYLRER